MENSHNAPKQHKKNENDDLGLIVQLDANLLKIQNDFYQFCNHSLQVINK